MAGSAPSPPDPNVAAIAGLNQATSDFPFTYLINALAQTGGKSTMIDPATGQPKTYDFTSLGTADVQNKVSNQMAGALLAIQQNLGAGYIAQRLADLKQSDPTGYAAYQQLFDNIQKEAAQTPPDMPLSQATQASIQGILKGSTSLTPEELTQVRQQQGAQDAASGIMLGNAPAAAMGTAAVNAVDQKTNQAEAAASQYLSQGTTPGDIAYRALQQNMSNEANFVNGTNPTAQFSSLSGAQNGAAPNPNTGYQAPTINQQQAAVTGINQANQQFAYQDELSQGTANPYLAGLNFGIKGLQVAGNAGLFSSAASNPYVSQFNSFAASPAAQISLPNASAYTQAPIDTSSISLDNAGLSSGAVGLDAGL